MERVVIKVRHNGPYKVTGPIKLGRPEEFTIAELARQVLELTGSRSKIEFLPLPSDDPRQRKPDVRRARSILDWEAKTTLREGLVPTIAYFEEQLRRPGIAGIQVVGEEFATRRAPEPPGSVAAE